MTIASKRCGHALPQFERDHAAEAAADQREAIDAGAHRPRAQDVVGEAVTRNQRRIGIGHERAVAAQLDRECSDDRRRRPRSCASQIAAVEPTPCTKTSAGAASVRGVRDARPVTAPFDGGAVACVSHHAAPRLRATKAQHAFERPRVEHVFFGQAGAARLSRGKLDVAVRSPRAMRVGVERKRDAELFGAPSQRRRADPGAPFARRFPAPFPVRAAAAKTAS